ncbi:response regulator [Cryomorphaceae bacterium 1068]|nr:response regulator [Cryomorphaceae bacterium 1068]
MSKIESSKKVLVVDDERDIGFLMKILLKSEGYEVQFVQTLDQAKEALERDDFHTVFLDLNLDNEYGLDLVPVIRSFDHQPTIAVITAQKELKIRKEVEDSNVDHLIEKPFNRKRILEVLSPPH